MHNNTNIFIRLLRITNQPCATHCRVLLMLLPSLKQLRVWLTAFDQLFLAEWSHLAVKLQQWLQVLLLRQTVVMSADLRLSQLHCKLLSCVI